MADNTNNIPINTLAEVLRFQRSSTGQSPTAGNQSLTDYEKWYASKERMTDPGMQAAFDAGGMEGAMLYAFEVSRNQEQKDKKVQGWKPLPEDGKWSERTYQEFEAVSAEYEASLKEHEASLRQERAIEIAKRQTMMNLLVEQGIGDPRLKRVPVINGREDDPVTKENMNVIARITASSYDTDISDNLTQYFQQAYNRANQIRDNKGTPVSSNDNPIYRDGYEPLEVNGKRNKRTEAAIAERQGQYVQANAEQLKAHPELAALFGTHNLPATETAQTPPQQTASQPAPSAPLEKAEDGMEKLDILSIENHLASKGGLYVAEFLKNRSSDDKGRIINQYETIYKKERDQYGDDKVFQAARVVYDRDEKGKGLEGLLDVDIFQQRVDAELAKQAQANPPVAQPPQPPAPPAGATAGQQQHQGPAVANPRTHLGAVTPRREPDERVKERQIAAWNAHPELHDQMGGSLEKWADGYLGPITKGIYDTLHVDTGDIQLVRGIATTASVTKFLDSQKNALAALEKPSQQRPGPDRADNSIGSGGAPQAECPPQATVDPGRLTLDAMMTAAANALKADIDIANSAPRQKVTQDIAAMTKIVEFANTHKGPINMAEVAHLGNEIAYNEVNGTLPDAPLPSGAGRGQALKISSP